MIKHRFSRCIEEIILRFLQNHGENDTKGHDSNYHKIFSPQYTGFIYLLLRGPNFCVRINN